MASATTSPDAREIVALLGQRSRDPVFFSEEILGVKLNPAQRRWLRLACRLREGSTFEWFYRRVVHVAANQIGKTLGLAILLLWAAHTKMGIRNDNWDSWFSSPWQWYHLAPTHPVSLHVYKDIAALMQGAHPAQEDKETGIRRTVRWMKGLGEEVKFDGAYPGFQLWNGSQIHFRTSAEKAKGIQGVRAHGVSIDEAALEPHLIEVLDKAVKMRLASTSGPLWLISTPDGINDYWEVVESIKQAGNITFHERVWEAPAKRQALIISHITDNVGFGFTQEEVDFMEADLDPATKEQMLRGDFLQPLDAFFVPEQQIRKAWVAGLPERQKPKNNHRYVIFWDPSLSNDPTVALILDVTRKPYVGVYFERWERPLGIHSLISEMMSLQREWSTRDEDRDGFAPRAVTAFDSTSMGGVAIKQSLDRLSPKRGLNFAGKTKINALTNARAMLARQDVVIPESWLRLQREVFSYRLDDKQLVQDAVMAFAGACHVAARGFSGAPTKKFMPGYRAFDPPRR